MTETTETGGAARPVSPSPADWDDAQLEKASLYGMCGQCRAPRDVVTSEPEPGAVMMEFQCLNGHRGPGV